MTLAKLPQPSTDRPRRMLSVSSIAEMFGVVPNTVHQWIIKGNNPDLPEWPPFPEADIELPTSRPDGAVSLGWDPSREPEFRAWKARLPGKGWRRGHSGDVRYTTMQHVGRRPGRKRKGQPQ